MVNQQQIAEQIAKWSLKEKVGQLFILAFRVNRPRRRNK